MAWRHLPQPLSPPPGSPRRRKELQRSELQRSSSLSRVTPLRRRRLRVVRDEPGRDAWKQPVGGLCACGCLEYAPRLDRHHMVLESIVRRENGSPWSFANSMLIHPHCHRNHHDKHRRIPFDAVPAVAVEFAVDLLGDVLAALYFERHYSLTPTPTED